MKPVCIFTVPFCVSPKRKSYYCGHLHYRYCGCRLVPVPVFSKEVLKWFPYQKTGRILLLMSFVRLFFFCFIAIAIVYYLCLINNINCMLQIKVCFDAVAVLQKMVQAMYLLKGLGLYLIILKKNGACFTVFLVDVLRKRQVESSLLLFA